MLKTDTVKVIPGLGAEIAKILVEKQWTQKTLAKKIGAAPASVSYWVAERHFPNIEMVNKLISVLGTEFETAAAEKLKAEETRLAALSSGPKNKGKAAKANAEKVPVKEAGTEGRPSEEPDDKAAEKNDGPVEKQEDARPEKKDGEAGQDKPAADASPDWMFAITFVKYLEEKGMDKAQIIEAVKKGFEASMILYENEVSRSEYRPGEIVTVKGSGAPVTIVVQNRPESVICISGNRKEEFSKELVRHTGKVFAAKI